MVQKDNNEKKGELHPRNKHIGRYDLPKLIETYAPLGKYVSENKYGDLSIDFFDPEAVKTLNQALLKEYYNIEYWDIPQGSLTPPIPSRADYLHYLYDLIGAIKGQQVTCLDIGVGANCIYPIIGCSEYDWNFIGTDIDANSLKNAKKIIDNNNILKGKVELRLQQNRYSIFDGVINQQDYFDVVICNPPFHDSQKSAEKSSQRKLRNLTGKSSKDMKLNFGGSSNELWCKGGEVEFILTMIYQSSFYAKQCEWFTSLVSNEDNINALIKEINRVRAKEYRIIEMSQGNKKSRIIAWRF